MKKYLLFTTTLIICVLLHSNFCLAQSSTEQFETESNGSTSFTDNGVVFNVLSSNTFKLRGNLSNAGWSGTFTDNRFIDNVDNIGPGASFSIKTTSNLFKANKFWMFLGANQNQAVTGTLTITGKLSGVTKFTQTKTTGFASSTGTNNGYTLIDLASLNGQDYSNAIIDQLQITLGGAYTYARFDAFTWNKDAGVILVDRPTATIVVADNALKIGETSLVIFTFSEAVTGFDNTDLTISNGSLSNVSTSDGGVTWTATFTPTNNITDATNVITLNKSGVMNAAGYQGLGTTDSNNFSVDTQRPTASIVVAKSFIGIGQTSMVTITFNEAVAGFNNADLIFVNGTLSNVASVDGGITWTATYTPDVNINDATNVITLANNGVIDLAGNTGSGQTTSNNYALDSQRPTATIVISDYLLSAGETSAVTITFSEVVNGFDNSDLTVPNGTLSNVISSDGSITWTATFTPNTGVNDATNLITLNNTGIADLAGNIGTGITNSGNYNINTIAPLTATSSSTLVSCNGGTNGTASVTASGGVGGYTYSWWPSGGTASTANGLGANTYTCTITDAFNTVITKTITITQPDVLTAAGSKTDVLCNGQNNGTATVYPSGGTPGYTYSWSPSGGNSATATSLGIGNYSCLITDANGCTTTRNFTITQPSTITATTDKQDATCVTPGQAIVVPSGGAGGYTYLWSPSGQTTQLATGLSPGSHSCLITDANGCTLTKNFLITTSNTLVATASKTDILCNGANTGSAMVVPSGAPGPFTYVWSPSGGNAATANNLTAGNYSVIITASNGCSIIKNFTISQPNGIIVNKSQNNVAVIGGNTGSASVNVTGGVGAYTYVWSPYGGTSATATGLVAGTYSVTIKDANLCQRTETFIITEPIPTPTNGIIYVKKGATGLGSSWNNPLGELADALKFAKTNNAVTTNPQVTQIWVAKGTYKPMYTPEDGQNFKDSTALALENQATRNHRDRSFLMVNDVNVYGGFPATGQPTMADRNWTANPTILSGDFDGDDAANIPQDQLRIHTSRDENAYHVIVAANNTSAVITELNGFVIKDGNANGNNYIMVNGLSVHSSNGGGIFSFSNNSSSSVTVNNSSISGNSANDGGGIFSFSNSSSSDVTANNSSISGNSANSGAGISSYSSSPSSSSNVIVNNSSIIGNLANNDGGGISSASFSSTFKATNSIISGNSASNGAGIYSLSSSTNLIKLLSTTLAGNIAPSFIYYLGGTKTLSTYNSIVYGNKTSAGADATIVANIGSLLTNDIQYSLIQGESSTAGGNLNGTSASYTTTNVFTDANNGNYTLKAESPAIGKGSNALYAANGGNLATDKDLAGNNRLMGTNIDMGAYEALIQSQSINPIAAITKIYGDVSFEPGGTSTSGLPLTYFSADNSIAEVLPDGKISIKKAGTVNITASQAGDANYSPAIDVVFSLTINKKPVTINLIGTPPITKVYDGNTNATITATNLSFINGNVVNGDELTIVLSSNTASYDSADVGTGKSVTVPLSSISLGGTGLSNYEIANTTDVAANVGAITKAAITGISFADASFEYDGTAKSLEIRGSLPTGVMVSYTGNGEVNAGSYIVTAFINGGANYQSQTLTATLTINKIAITGIGLADATFTYNGTSRSLTISGNLPTGATVTYTNNGQTNAGIYAVTANVNGGNNYQNRTLSATLTIAKAIITGVSLADGSFTYDGTVRSLEITGALPTGVTVSYTNNGQSNAGIYTVTANINGGNNYESQNLSAILTINKATITGIGFADGSFMYEGTPRSLAISGNLPIGAAVSYTNNGQTNAGIYTVAANINGGNNYESLSLSAKLEIQRAALTITANNATMCQGSNLPTFTAAYSGFKNGEGENSLTAKPIIITTAISSSVAGIYVITVSGAAANNYQISYVMGSLTINALPTVTINSNKSNSISKGETIQLTASGGNSYIWSGIGIVSGQNSAIVTARPNQSGTYTVRVTNANGCSKEHTFVLTVREDFAAIKATNILTLNGDGINDVWLVENIDMYPGNEVKIFDRAGRVLYSKRGYDNSWNGTVNGSPLAENTYYYIIDFGTNKLKQKGFITLVRE